MTSLKQPCPKCGQDAKPIKTMADSWELFCLNCREVVDDRPTLHPAITPRLGHSERQRPRKNIPDTALFKKTSIPRRQKPSRFCEGICIDVDDEVREEYETMYSSKIISPEDYYILSRLTVGKPKSKLLMTPFKTDEEYEKYLKQIEEHNALQTKTNRKLEPIPRIIPSNRDYRHCGHCKINIEVSTLMPLPLPKSERERQERDNEGFQSGYEEFEIDGQLYKQTTSVSKTEGMKVTVEVITPKEIEERKMAEYRSNMQNEQRRLDDILFSSRISPLFEGKYNVKPTKTDIKIAKKMAKFSERDPRVKDNPYNILMKRYKNGKIGYNRCLCCNQKTGPGLVDYYS